ncbi:hypothetical protein LX32DRAFT_652550 [Colletotrichum zoysiae]|uniref:Lipoprotein n=1 Tax=Colletotrichum zoysiae TaxID=1216348 RepID=A0AAD9HI35_9PEZI|nr:hypothetical protein LX32DRAFT_652550 [Colletotrichum zoysiae]
MKLLFNTILLITTFFLSSVLSCSRIPLPLGKIPLAEGNKAYTVIKDPSSRAANRRYVYTRGYEDGKSPVLMADIDIAGRKITVKNAYNGRDATPNHIYLNDMLKALWENDGGRLQNLRSIEFSQVVNLKSQVAFVKIRKRLGLAKGASFVIKEPAAKGAAALNKSQAKKVAASWEDLFQSPFGKVARRMANEGGNTVDQFETRDARLG